MYHDGRRPALLPETLKRDRTPGERASRKEELSLAGPYYRAIDPNRPVRRIAATVSATR